MQTTLEITNFLPVKETVVAAGSYLLKLARDLKASGSDIVVEADVASVFGRAVIQPEVESNFRKAVSDAIVRPFANGSPIALHSGPGPTVIRAFTPEGQQYLRTVITLSFLGYFVDRLRLATMISEGMTKQVENCVDQEWRNTGIEDINAMLVACSTQTASFSRASYR
jgi:hypothetical protein